MKRRSPLATLGALDLLEESVHALRRAAPGTLLCYYAGTVPFVLAALFYWADMSQSGLAEEHLVPGALGLTALFAWMKLWQSAFALKLSAQFANEATPRLSFGDWLRAIGSQTFLQASGLIVIALAAQILLPLGWVYAFFQNVTVFGLREPALGALVRRSWKQAMSAPRQNHAALLVLGLFGLFVSINVAVAIVAAPQLLKMLAGIETHFTLSLAATLNTTFLAVVIGVTYLCFDPLVKAAYVLRCFYGEARTTGEDLRVAQRMLGRAAALVVLAAALLLPARGWAAAPAPAPGAPATKEASELNRSIDEVLKRREYAWRSPRAKVEKAAKDESDLLKYLRDWSREALKKIAQWIADVLAKIFRPRLPGGGRFGLTAQGFMYIAIAVVLVIVGILLWMLWRARKRSAAGEIQATPATPLPDLASEDVTGSELPVDGWTQLALELLQRGELRLAMRAFYFSSLAHLAERNLVTLAKFKSNRDYERELRRRSHALPELAGAFSENVTVFDRVWYGLHEINTELLQRFRANVERMREA